jgi:acyl transferase domain-containing protein/NAD(P)-dependent dehydrogenase (short-subunit alcohol dehydrogenase family)/acyl carrier protein
MMDTLRDRAIAIVGLGAVLPDAGDVSAFWRNIVEKCYSITEVPANRWRVADYYDPDPNAPDKTYSKIGGWVQGFEFDWRRYRIPPKVAAAMDEGQQWAVTIAEQALRDYGYPDRPLDTERTAVVLGTAMGGELHYITHLRISFPEYARLLESVTEFSQLPPDVRAKILAQWHERVDAAFPPVTEDSMPGELPNIVSGRVANVLNLRGANFITDAACAASLAGLEAAVEMLLKREADAVLTGGVDHNMGASTFIKFSKIGALSATGTRPFGDGADGFVMGEGAAAFLVKRLADAERDGDRIYAVVRGVAGASDGKGKGIYAPNPIGQQLAMRRAWEEAGLDPATAGLIEAHGTSTRVGDVVEVESLSAIFGAAPSKSIALGSVKSNVGHLKAGAGAAGLLKATLALHNKLLPPTLHADPPNPNIDFDHTAFYLNHEAREWPRASGTPRRCGVSAYGFGGTNFHAVLEEYVPAGSGQWAVGNKTWTEEQMRQPSRLDPRPVRGILAVGAETPADLKRKLSALLERVQNGWNPPVELPDAQELKATERLVIDFGDAQELGNRLIKAVKALEYDKLEVWRSMQAQGIFRGNGPKPGKLAFLFPGQGSQYLNMGRKLAALSPVVADMLSEADHVMTGIIGRPLTPFIFVDPADDAALKQAEHALKQTEITQPAMLTLDMALYRLLATYGFKPNVVMGHSLGEYAALIAAGILPFADALEAAAARGREMAKVQVEDKGWMAAVSAPYDVVAQTLKEVDGYVVIANNNSTSQSVIGGASKAVEQAIQLFQSRGYEAIRLPVSHAFHTSIVAPASGPLRQVLDRLHVAPPKLPLVGNVTGDFYPQTVEEIKDMLQRQIASPVQWSKGLETLYVSGARVFVEVGPKKALKGFVDDVLGGKPDIYSLFTNHPKVGELESFNQALCGLYAAGYAPEQPPATEPPAEVITVTRTQNGQTPAEDKALTDTHEVMMTAPNGSARTTTDNIGELLRQALVEIALSGAMAERPNRRSEVYDRNEPPAGSVVISGTGIGLPGAEKPVMDESNIERILRGELLIDLIPERFHKRMVNKHITRLVKSEDGSGRFETIQSLDEVIKLAGRPGSFDLTAEYGVPDKLVEALDITTQLAMAAGLDALREAGIPLVQTYRKTTIGTYLPDRCLLPEALRDETGVIFASAFPGNDRFAQELSNYHTWQNRLDQLRLLDDLRRATDDPATLAEIERRSTAVRDALDREPYEFDRRFLFRILSMGHSQFAEYIGARGPNTQVNAACASTTQAIALAEDWIRAGRCRRVLIIAADDVSGDNLLEWAASGFLAVGAATTNGHIEEAALPFDKRRHGTIIGMGAAALVVESEDAVRERGMRGIVELLSSETRNSAYHGSRLDVEHISMVMDDLVTAAERRFRLNRLAIAPRTVFMSHETYTPARGGSASAEIFALRRAFGEAASAIIIANTKGFTGHPMGVGIEDVIAVKILETGIVPPVPNFKEVDEELGPLNLSRGGRYPVQYAIHLAAGFGSQIALTFTRRIPGGPNRVADRPHYQRWLADVSGYDRPELEVEKRVLRVKAEGAPGRAPAPSAWTYGTGPVVRAAAPGEITPVDDKQRSPDVRRWNNGKDFAKEARPAAAQVAAIPRHDPDVPVMPSASAPPAPAATLAAPAVAVEAVQAVATPVAVPVAPPVTPAPAQDAIAEQVLGIVAEKTGYPQEMLELDLDLEADLGIDTVKQAETFLAISTAFDIPRKDDLKLRDYPTLAHAIQFVKDNRPDLVGPLQAGTNGAQPAHEPAPVAAPPVAVAAPVQEDIAERVLAIVAEKTGYPQEMLESDLDLEADLGIDTVKQAETFLAIRTAFDIPRKDDLKLRDYPTLAHAIQFVKDNRPDLAKKADGTGDGAQPAPLSPIPTAVIEAAPEVAAAPVPAAFPLEDADLMPRRVPQPALRPALGLCKLTGVTLDQSSRVVVMHDEGKVGQALVKRLKKRGVTVLPLDPSGEADKLEAQVKGWLDEGLIQGVYWLPALDVEPGLEEMDLATWRALNQKRVKNLYTIMRALYDAVSRPNTFLVSATRLGGLHGYGPQAAVAPLGGAVTGFTKAYKRERREALVKAVDFEADRSPAQIADALLAETLADPGVVEVGIWQGERYTVTLTEQPCGSAQPGLLLGPETVFVVTGAAGGITSAIVADLAAASRGIFYLLDLVALPQPDDKDIVVFRTDKEALKQKLIEQAKASGERPTPAKIDKQIMAIERREAALRAVESVQAAGGTASYYAANLLDSAAVAAALDQVRRDHGRVDVLIHAAGLEISRGLPDKDPQQFNLVYDVKAEGFFNLLQACKGMPLGATVVFSSVAGRFGNAGQTDYSAANDLLCKITSNLRAWRPETHAIAIDWTAWGEIGMATRGSIPKIMEMAGIEMLPPHVGIPTVRRELLYSGGEVVVGGPLGMLTQEWDETGGLDPDKAERWLAARKPRLPMVGQVNAARQYGGLHVETPLDPKVQPFLYDHALDGTPLLPGVMTTESFAELGALASLSGGEGHVVAVEDVAFQQPFKFYRMEPQTLHLDAQTYPAEQGESVVLATLRSVRPPAKPGLPVQEKTHATGRVWIGQQPEPPEDVSFTPPVDGATVAADEIYRLYFHGPAYQVLEQVWLEDERAIGLMAAPLPPDTEPADSAESVAPRLIELCFQTAGIWEIKRKGVFALPWGFRAVKVYRRPEGAGTQRLYSLVQARDGGKAFDAQVVDESGRVYVELNGYYTIALG